MTAIPWVFVSFIASNLSAALDLLVKSYGVARINWTGRRSFVDEFFPRTEASIMDLDQAVALLAEMGVLGFRVYSTADARYKR